MKLTVFGKYGPYEKSGGGATSCYLIEDKGARLLLDMGAGSLANMLKYVAPTQIDALFLSHLHFDHTSDLLTYRYLLETLDRRLTIYTCYEDSEWYRVLLTHPLFDVVNIKDGDTVEISGLSCSFHALPHTVPNLGIRIDGTSSFFYTGDTSYTPLIAQYASGCHAVLADCSKAPNTNSPHMTVENAALLQQEVGCRLFAGHQDVDYDPKDYLSQYYPDIISIEENTSYEI